jgi:PPOX class probable F420-dependent enzyme
VPLTPEVRRLLDSPNYAHLATLRKDGSPQSIAVWVGLEGGSILVGTGYDTGKARHTRRDPRVSLSITDRENPYKTATVRGRVVEQRPDEDCVVMDAIARKYTGEAFPFRGKGRIALVIEPDEVRYSELPFTHRPS